MYVCVCVYTIRGIHKTVYFTVLRYYNYSTVNSKTVNLSGRITGKYEKYAPGQFSDSRTINGNI